MVAKYAFLSYLIIGKKVQESFSNLSILTSPQPLSKSYALPKFFEFMIKNTLKALILYFSLFASSRQASFLQHRCFLTFAKNILRIFGNSALRILLKKSGLYKNWWKYEYYK